MRSAAASGAGSPHGHPKKPYALTAPPSKPNNSRNEAVFHACGKEFGPDLIECLWERIFMTRATTWQLQRTLGLSSGQGFASLLGGALIMVLVEDHDECASQ